MIVSACLGSWNLVRYYAVNVYLCEGAVPHEVQESQETMKS
jgi:hypothetical protein